MTTKDIKAIKVLSIIATVAVQQWFPNLFEPLPKSR